MTTKTNALPTCTENELNLLFAIADSDFQDANPIANSAVWVWSVEFPAASHGGTASSLQKKGLIGTQTYDRGRDQDICWLTEAGVAVLLAAGRVVLREDGSLNSRATRALLAAEACRLDSAVSVADYRAAVNTFHAAVAEPVAVSPRDVYLAAVAAAAAARAEACAAADAAYLAAADAARDIYRAAVDAAL